MQNRAVGQETSPKSPVAGERTVATKRGADHDVPFHSVADPSLSVATQNWGDPHESPTIEAEESMTCGLDHCSEPVAPPAAGPRAAARATHTARPSTKRPNRLPTVMHGSAAVDA